MRKPFDITARRIVHDIVDDLTTRRGLRQEWEAIDDVTEREILAAWTRLVKDRLEDAMENKS